VNLPPYSHRFWICLIDSIIHRRDKPLWLDIDPWCKLNPLYKQPTASLQPHSIKAFLPFCIGALHLPKVSMANKQIIPFGIDLNQPPLVDDSLAIVPILEPTPLTVTPPKPRPRSYGQSYFAQVCQPMLPSPPKRLLSKDAPPKGPIIRLPSDVKLLPLKPNETLT
jgi:hypothetical protein